MTTRPRVSKTMTSELNIFESNYHQTIADLFIRLRGRSLSLAPLDVQMIDDWHERGIPLHLLGEEIAGASGGPFFMLDELEMRCKRASMEVIETAIEKGRKLWTNHLVTCEKRERSAA